MNTYLKLLTFNFLLVMSSLNLYAQDLTGTWEAKQNVGKKTINYSMYIAKTNSGYIAITELKEATKFQIKVPPIDPLHLNKTQIHINTNATENKGYATGEMIGSFSKGVFYYADLGLIGDATLNVKLDAGSFNYIKSHGKERLVMINHTYNLDYSKKNNNFPDEYLTYKKDLIDIGSIKFVNGDKSPKVKYNDRGLLSFSVANNSDFDLQRINISLHLREQNAEIQGLEGNNGTFSLGKSQSLNPEIDIYSGFNLPTDSIHFNVVGSFNNVQLFTKTFALPTLPFFLTNKTTVNSSSDQILSIVRSYYGLNKAPYAPIAVGLNQTVSSGSNKMAAMWKAAFLSTGKGGYELDEEAAQDLAKKDYKNVLAAARQGDAEAQYLMFYTVGLGLTGDPTRSIAGEFLKKSADAGFPPAMYDYALYLMRDSAYDDSYSYLINCYNKGVQKAAATIGYFYQKGYSVSKEFSQAIEWYNKGDAFGDPEAMMLLARIYNLSDEERKADPRKVIFYATKAANLKSKVALNYLAKIYLNGRSGVSVNIPKALALYKEAAALGDNTSMASLAYIYRDGIPGVKKDDKLALSWAIKSAENGGADCMALLARAYDIGNIAEKDIIRARFWATQAWLHGTGEADNRAQQAQTNGFINILSHMDFSSKTVYLEDSYGNIGSVDEGPDLLGEAVNSTLGEVNRRRQNQQEQINGMKLIYTADNKKIYGGTIASKIATNFSVSEGQKVKLQTYGTVNLGGTAGVGGPDGINGFQSFCIDPTLPHGAFIVKIGGKWILAGSNRTFIMPADGVLQFAINDADYTNNVGYFDFVVTVE